MCCVMCNEVIQASFDLFCMYFGQSMLIYIIAINYFDQTIWLIATINVVVPHGLGAQSNVLFPILCGLMTGETM